MGMEVSFHKQRRMFALLENARLVVAGSNDPRSHKEWLQDYGSLVRGYADKTGLYFYSTENCQAKKGDWQLIRKYLYEIGCAMDLDENLPVHEGTIPGPIGERWLPAKTLGTIKELLGG